GAGGLSLQRRGAGGVRLHLVGVLRLVRGDEQGPAARRGEPAGGAARAGRRARRDPAAGAPGHAVRDRVALAGAERGGVRARPAASHVNPDFEVYVSLRGLIDVAAEVKRLGKQLEEKRKHLDGVRAKLANPGFRDRAPADVVQQQCDLAADLETQIRTMEANL